MTLPPSCEGSAGLEWADCKHEKGPVLTGGASRKLLRACSAHAKSLGTPAHGGLDEPVAKHGRAMKNAHSDHPGVTKCEGAGCAMRSVRARGADWRQINRLDGRRLWANSQLRYDFFLGAVRLDLKPSPQDGGARALTQSCELRLYARLTVPLTPTPWLRSRPARTVPSQAPRCRTRRPRRPSSCA